MKSKRIYHMILFIGAIGISIVCLFFVITTQWIGYEVKAQCQEAKKEYRGDCVEALTSLLADETKGFVARNSAIWALGQLGDERALPVLQKYYTGIIPDREPLAKTISQYELKKALALVSGGTNITAPFWRIGTLLK